jgi:hypothetical protein
MILIWLNRKDYFYYIDNAEEACPLYEMFALVILKQNWALDFFD